MSKDSAELIQWLKGRPLWIQEGARLIHENGELSAENEENLAAHCLEEADAKASGKTVPAKSDIPESALKISASSKTVRLNAISEPRGIDRLNPKRPLKFAPEKLNIVYGTNGCGKSGYIRILKRACGTRNARPLMGDVYDPAKPAQSCKLAFSIDEKDQEITWSPSDGAHGELDFVEIYDGDTGRVYTSQENQVLFEPPLLAMFQKLIDAAGRIDEVIRKQIPPSKKPELPPAHAATKAAKWYAGILPSLKDEEIGAVCSWEDADQQKLDKLAKRLAEANPADEAKKLRIRKSSVSGFLATLGQFKAGVSPEAVTAIREAKLDALARRKAASEDAQKVFGQAPLVGIGEASWKLLWEQARAFSVERAYEGKPFPEIGEEARCVLCQQPLNAEARARLASFESYVKGSLESQALAAEARVATLLKALPKPETEDALAVRLASFQVPDEGSKAVAQYYEALRRRLNAILNEESLPDMPPEDSATELAKFGEHLENQAQAYDEDAKKGGKELIREEAKELAAAKWLSEQKAAVIAERDRLSDVQRLEAARRLTNTKALSDKKSALTAKLITEEYVKRFQSELSALGASELRIELVTTRTTKGKVWHQIRLKGAHGNPATGDILSEGEQRIVSIAAFLADSEGLGTNTPFIFDDPISSLDQKFEEATVRRLVALSKTRQVIVFTHRISLLILLQDAAEAENIDPLIIGLTWEPWGTGEVSALPLFAMKPKRSSTSC